MSKKMKSVAFESYEDARSRFKHQTLLQDYMELQQETEDAKNNLMALKQRKLLLEAEVRFLRQRYRFLLKNKSSTPQEQVFVQPQPTQMRKSKKEKVRFGKQATLLKEQPAKKKKTHQSINTSPEFDLNIGSSLYNIKEQSVQRAVANQRVRINGPKASPFLDMSPKVNFFKGQEPMGQAQEAVIDLNHKSREEEELQERYKAFDLPTQDLIRNNMDDVQSPICRNVGGVAISGAGSSGQPRKRKISWQDPVALRV